MKGGTLRPMILLALICAALMCTGADASAGRAASVSGDLKKWHRVTLSFTGPVSNERASSPNPFLDYRLQVRFRGPGGQVYNVPGFYDGNGRGGSVGRVWRVRFTPDQAGKWTYRASFRKGSRVAVKPAPGAGAPVSFDGASGSFVVMGRDRGAPGFLKHGRLEYSGGHYLKFRDGPYWIKGGADSPENLLGYTGFDNTPAARHSYAPHTVDWRAGDPVFNASGPDGGKGFAGAVNYLSSRGVNSVYFLPMNIGGDGRDTSPFVAVADWTGGPANGNLHYDISKLRQWERAFSYMQRRGIHLHVVLMEAEAANKNELDGGRLGVERKLYYRELAARFAHHNALQWNVSEEYDFQLPLPPARIKSFAGYIKAVDPYNHPITVHNLRPPSTSWTPFLGDGRFSSTSLQYPGGVAGHGAEVEAWRRSSARAGRPVVVSMDELRSATPANADAQRRDILWPTYLSGGQLEWYVGAEDQSLESFGRYERLWDYTWYARKFMQRNLPFWRMRPADSLLTGETGQGQVFSLPGKVYAIYLPNASSGGQLNLSKAPGGFTKRWYNPRTGSFAGEPMLVKGGGCLRLGLPPNSPASDWVVLLKASKQASAGPPASCGP